MSSHFAVQARSSLAVMLLTAATACSAGVPVAEDGARTDSPSAADTTAADLLERSRALMRAERYDEARALLEAELAIRPDWAEGHVGLALTYVKQERWQTARQLLERGLELDPGLHKARLPLGWCLYYLGQLEPAREEVEAFLAEEPDYADAVYALALIEFEGQDLERASELLRRVVMLGRRSRDLERQALAHTRLADLFLRRGETSRARLELERSLELTPDDARVHFKMSHVLQLLGDAEGAEASRLSYRRLQREAP